MMVVSITLFLQYYSVHPSSSQVSMIARLVKGASLGLLVFVGWQVVESHAFQEPIAAALRTTAAEATTQAGRVSCHDVSPRPNSAFQQRRTLMMRYLSNDPNSGEDGVAEVVSSLTKSQQTFFGFGGTFASLVVCYSEYVLSQTGCGVPAGPGGIFGLLEGLSYLGVVGIVALSVVTKVQTGSGLPAGPKGLLGAAEGLSYLAIVAGLVVLGLQVTNYGYIPNAVPMEGAMCS